MRKSSCRKRRDFEILDITTEIIRDYKGSSPAQSDDDAESPAIRKLSTGSAQQGDLISSASSSTARDSNLSLDSRRLGPGLPLHVDDASPSASRQQTESAVANLLYLRQGGQPDAIDAALHDPLGAVPMDIITDYIDQFQAFTPDGAFEDGIFLPGSAYHELHSTLRNHLIQEVRSNAPTRPCTPHVTEDTRGDYTIDGDTDELHLVPESISLPSVDPPLITKSEEIILWRNWFDEIAPWLDKFDNARHFQIIIPTMASEDDFLRYSILALSSRQMELKETTQPTDRSLALYQEAIHLLLPQLPTRSTSVIATCVILCVLEMLSCSPKAWRRHLDGCASLMEAVGINGFVGGVEQALFWCFARMDVCGGLISSVKTLIPTSHWASKLDFEADIQLFQSMNDFADWANVRIQTLIPDTRC